ncbi:MAG TPA: Flp pilus assembly protein CpaB [Candidatus Nitrosotalea sp.]|nr:Flp pilus assembly protein CpaB [Candidatus Nitrosotalea sp.]
MAAKSSPRRINWPLVALGLVVFGFGFVAVTVYGQSLRSAPSGSTAAVLVAARDLALGSVLAPGDLEVSHLNSADVPPSALSTVASAQGRVLLIALRRGQPVLANFLTGAGASSGSGAGSLHLAQGLVAYTLPASEQQAVAGYIEAGDRIDVIALVVPRGGGPTNVRTVFVDVPVIRIGAAGQASGAGTASSLTVAVSECDAEYLTWLLANAQLKYSLPSGLDQAPAATSGSCPGGAGGVVGVSSVQGRWPGLY